MHLNTSAYSVGLFAMVQQSLTHCTQWPSALTAAAVPCQAEAHPPPLPCAPTASIAAPLPHFRTPLGSHCRTAAPLCCSIPAFLNSYTSVLPYHYHTTTHCAALLRPPHYHATALAYHHNPILPNSLAASLPHSHIPVHPHYRTPPQLHTHTRTLPRYRHPATSPLE